MTITRIRSIILCLALLTLAWCSGTTRLQAQSTTQGSIAGTVLDPSGAVVSGVAVTIHNLGTNAEIKPVTDDSGYFKAPLLEPGTYVVSIAAPGFASYTAKNVTVTVG